MIATSAAIMTLLGRKRKKGRGSLAAGASEYQYFHIMTPPAHPLQDPHIIAGLASPCWQRRQLLYTITSLHTTLYTVLYYLFLVTIRIFRL